MGSSVSTRVLTGGTAMHHSVGVLEPPLLLDLHIGAEQRAADAEHHTTAPRPRSDRQATRTTKLLGARKCEPVRPSPPALSTGRRSGRLHRLCYRARRGGTWRSRCRSIRSPGAATGAPAWSATHPLLVSRPSAAPPHHVYIGSLTCQWSALFDPSVA
jgi:hypothetical protein